MINHDSQAENPGFDNVISQFDKLRTDMNAGFEALHATLVRKLIQMGVLNTFGMIAILAIDRWWL